LFDDVSNAFVGNMSSMIMLLRKFLKLI